MATKYTKEVLSEAVANSASVAGVLRYLNLRQAGVQYELDGVRTTALPKW